MKTTKEIYLNSVPKLSMWYRKFRIVQDNYLGYEVQCWRLWFPFWTQYGGVNTHETIEQCIYHIRNCRRIIRYL